MTTKIGITLPLLPEATVPGLAICGYGGIPRYLFTGDQMQAYARAAVEADRQGRVPSDDDVATACKSLGWDLDAQEEADMILLVRTVMSRYSSGRPAKVRCNHCGWHGADADLVRDVAADEPEDGAADVCPQCKRIGDLQDIGLPAASAEEPCFCDRMYPDSNPDATCGDCPRDYQPAASAEPAVGADDDAVDHFAVAMKDKLAQARAKGRYGWREIDPSDLSMMLRSHVDKGDPRDVANFCMFLWSLGKPISAAPDPVAQEPVAVIGSGFGLLWIGSGPIAPIVERHGLKVGSKLYATPVAAQEQPTDKGCLTVGRPVSGADGLPDALIPAHPNLKYLCGIAHGSTAPALLRGNIMSALRWIDALQTRLAHPQPALSMQGWINQWPALTDDDHVRMRAAWNAGYHAGCQPQPSGNSGELPSAQDRGDAERYRWATALDDNSETLHSIVLSYGGDQAKINERVDVYRADAARAAKGADHD